jgi:nitroimidazol reductase NimA-like FMN-containing flavoprotein (pyridoxamine 5'-phosphate oxidase superfamily)
MTDSDDSTYSLGTDGLGTGTLIALPESECRELLSIGLIGRIAFNNAGGIQLLPVNYFYLDGCVYFRVDAASELGGLADGADEVAFEVDYLDELVKQAWSVLAKGPIAAVTEATELESLLGERRLEPWALGDRQLYLRLEPATLTGRKVKRNAR